MVYLLLWLIYNLYIIYIDGWSLCCLLARTLDGLDEIKILARALLERFSRNFSIAEIVCRPL